MGKFMVGLTRILPLFFLGFILLAFIPNLAFSQDIAGDWTGQVFQAPTQFPYSLSLTQNGTQITGTARIEDPTDNQYYAVFSINGQIQNDILHYTEEQIIEQNPRPGTGWCLKTADLTIDDSATGMSGPWTAPGCAPGTISVTRSCPLTQASNYWYVAGIQCFAAVGAYGKMSQEQPHIDSENAQVGGHSLAEIGVSNVFSANGIDALEVGWIVWPSLFNDDLPHLFVFRTIGSQEQGGCYAWADNCGWVQVSNTEGHHPGAPVTITSNPEQYGIYYYQGNWWVNYQNDWIGHFPGSLWPNNRFTQFTKARWYGEVSHRLTQGGCTQMGNGTHGSEPNSALITDIGFINSDQSQTQANITGYVTDAFYYDMGNFNGHSFTYGGPGQCAR